MNMDLRKIMQATKAAESNAATTGDQAEFDRAEEQLRKARFLARTIFPYFAGPLTAMSIKMTNDAVFPEPKEYEDDNGKIVQVPKPKFCAGEITDDNGKEWWLHPTFGVDEQMRTYIHPMAVDSWIDEATLVSPRNPCKTCGKTHHHPLAYVAGVYIHEMWHPLRKHGRRARAHAPHNFNAKIWNVAADCFPAGTLLPGNKRIEDCATKIVDFEGNLVEITSQSGSVKATPDHRIMVRTRKHAVGLDPIVLNAPEWVAIKDIKVGDFVLSPKLKHTFNETEIDLRGYATVGKASLNRPLGNAAIKSIPLNEDLAWLMGLYAAEGHSDVSGAHFSLNGITEGWVADRIYTIAETFGRKAQVSIQEGRESSMKVTLSSVAVGRWLADVCGKGACNKQVPTVIMQHSNPAVRKAFIEGLVFGDGYESKRCGSSTTGVVLRSVSEALIFDMVLLLAQDGIGAHRGTIKRGPRQIGSSWTNKDLLLHTLSWNPEGNSTSTRIMNGHEVTTTHGRTKADVDGVWYPVKKTAEIPFSGKVYDMVEMEDHRYIVNGISVHNCEINDNIREFVKSTTMDRLCLPHSGQFPDTYKMEENLLAEEYYTILMKKAEEQQQKRGQKGGGQGKPDPNGQKSTGKGKGKPQQGQGQGDADGDGMPKMPEGGRCGSGADGQKKDYEDGDGQGQQQDRSPDGQGQQPNPGQGKDQNEGVGESEIDAMARRVAQDILDSAAKNPGTVPGGLVRWAGELLGPPKYNWRQELTSLIRYHSNRYVAGHKTTTYSRLNRLSSTSDFAIILPTHKKPKPHIAVVIDTSGSMDQAALKLAMEETEGLCKILNAPITLIDVDTEARVTEVKSVRHAKILGGGGTDMRVGINKALESKKRPSLVIVMTDGYSPFDMPQPADTGVIICLVGNNASADYAMPWMKIVHVKEDGANKKTR